MFDINNYDEKEYERERQERLMRQREEERIFDHNEEYDDDYNDDYDEQESDSGKKILLALFIGTASIVGYFGFNYLQNGTNQPQETVVSTVVNHSNELNSSKQKETTQELITTATPAIVEEKKEQKELAKTITPTSTPETSPVIASKESETVATLSPKISKESELNVINPETSPVIDSKESELNVTNNHNREKKPKIETMEELSHSVQKIVNSNEHKKVKSKKIVKKVVNKTIKKKRPKRHKARVVYYIRKGDTLASISKKFYGNPMKFQKIINANYSIKNSSTTLHLGQKIYVPK